MTLAAPDPYNRKPMFQIRMDPEIREKFEILHRRAQGQVPDRVFTRAELFDAVVTSATAVFDAGALPLTPPVTRDG